MAAALVLGYRAAKLMAPEEWAAGVRDLYRTAEPDGVFCYTFFKAVAVR